MDGDCPRQAVAGRPPRSTVAGGPTMCALCLLPRNSVGALYRLHWWMMIIVGYGFFILQSPSAMKNSR